jgi:hypothetical protein
MIQTCLPRRRASADLSPGHPGSRSNTRATPRRGIGPTRCTSDPADNRSARRTRDTFLRRPPRSCKLRRPDSPRCRNNKPASRRSHRDPSACRARPARNRNPSGNRRSGDLRLPDHAPRRRDPLRPRRSCRSSRPVPPWFSVPLSHPAARQPTRKY